MARLPGASTTSAIHRRTFLRTSTAGIGTAVLASFLRPEIFARSGSLSAAEADKPGIDKWTGVVNPLHHAAKVKRIIYLCMAGGPSHLETWDYKPKLAEMHGQPMPESFTKGKPIAQLQGAKLTCFGPQHKFQKFGDSGQEISEIFPHIGSVADEICIVRSIMTEAINHDPAHTFMNTGTTIPSGPRWGHGLPMSGKRQRELSSGLVAATSTGKFGQAQPIAARQWHSGFLPSRFQGVEFRSKGDPVLYVRSPAGVSNDRQRDVVEAVQRLNQLESTVVDDPEIATRISAYETAFRMQTSVPELMDVSNEPRHILEMYGTAGGDGSFAANCLLARRLAERGVRFIQLYHRDWDHHGKVKIDSAGTAKEVDQGCAALIKKILKTSCGNAGRYARDLGRRIRPHADGPGRRPRSPHQGLLDLDGRWRHQGSSLCMPPTSSAMRPSTTSCTSTTSTRRSCTFSASTTCG